ncbi:citrate lyase holo-[acyl-carrier protein] synthase [Salmonella enterica subsp. salamae serovar 6,7:z:1,5]|nr:citrate lyase holo-[acyl-carrier protein] synthase [Salmonella enterica subsp. salamae serovar 6,7:z:1,5]HCH7729736.1 citrate lyase holo-[acyl-carrier protein] synthase [Salmonella enterica subsp. enterica serovar Infantis]HCH7829769.1 citrate lyase holo-[acyl-carrier protein] synthase [Salmonella enterica subsp. enterica serovar Infantis]HCH7833146.1 citrate lyase holo-[acyl-carrier protein] synthase [Salmonella enterica subsp. enterica serovar Infantis]HCI4928256.1 citrate lyase holo-[acyl
MQETESCTLSPLMYGEAVSLTNLLSARERRAERQKALLTRFHQPILSLTLITPGPVKDSIGYRHVMAEALRLADQLFWRCGWKVLHHEVHWLNTGSEALWAVEQEAQAIKTAVVELEEKHPLGRLWDFDVISPGGKPLSREDYGAPARKCLICQRTSHLCCRSRKHSLPELTAHIEEMIRSWEERD